MEPIDVLPDVAAGIRRTAAERGVPASDLVRGWYEDALLAEVDAANARGVPVPDWVKQSLEKLSESDRVEGP
jgi:hypothetical protein